VNNLIEQQKEYYRARPAAMEDRLAALGWRARMHGTESFFLHSHAELA
jgi:hypothetical protein